MQNDTSINQTPLNPNYSLGILNDQHAQKTELSNEP